MGPIWVPFNQRSLHSLFDAIEHITCWMAWEEKNADFSLKWFNPRLKFPDCPPAADHPAADHPAADHPAADHRAADHPAADHPAADHPAADHPAADHPANDHPAPARWVRFQLVHASL